MGTEPNKQLIPQDDTITIHVGQNEPIMRIDQFISIQFPLYSRSFFKRLIEKNYLLLNNIPVKKAGTLIKPHDTITLTIPPHPILNESNLQEYCPAIKVIHTHEHFLIIYKPAGLTVHKPHAHSTEITLVDWLLFHHKEIAHVGSIDRPGIVHRLDKNTSGLLIVSRTNYAHTLFTALFKEHGLKKIYKALVKGHPQKTGTIRLSIGRHPNLKTKMIALDPQSLAAHSIAKLRDAITHYEVKQYFDTYSLVEITLVTGRTHQIRAHFAAIGHSLIGDSTYGKPSKLIARQALHAYSLSFVFDGTPFSFSHPIPDDINTLISQP